jgi:LemA protein
MAIWIVLAIAGLALFVLIGVYNGLVSKRIQVDNAWSQIDVQLKRRYDLIPNLVETVKGYATHEKGTLEAVIKARQTAIDASGVKDQAAAESMLTGALRQLMVVAENYPQLKANEGFLQLQEELGGTENRIGFSRQNYNDTVSHYNMAAQQFPSNIIANMFGFQPRAFFEIEAPTERAAPKVQF